MNNETKRTLLRVTRELIDNRGIEAVSMREVGRRAGLSRTAIYRHFNNKQSLLAAIVVEDFKFLSSRIVKLESTPTNPKRLLMKLLNSYYRFALESAEHYHLMFNTKWDNEKYPEIKDAAYLAFTKTREYVEDALNESNPAKHRPKEATAILYAFIHGLVELHLAGHSEIAKGLDNPELLIDRMIDSIF